MSQGVLFEDSFGGEEVWEGEGMAQGSREARRIRIAKERVSVGLRVGMVMEVYEGVGQENRRQDEVWIELPVLRSWLRENLSGQVEAVEMRQGFMKLKPGEYEWMEGSGEGYGEKAFRYGDEEGKEEHGKPSKQK